MCSILASFSSNTVDAKIDGSFNDLLSIMHVRGPDDRHVERLHGGAILGSTRLSIIDVRTHGRMPLKSVLGDTWIVYNGEIYNHHQLREELIGLGVSFRTGTDTEVVLNAYLQWGDTFISRLNGMFAFVIYDMRSDTIIAARDRFGAKPLYFAQFNDQLIFSSDFRVLRRLPGRSYKEFDDQAVSAYIMCRFVPGQKTILKGISKLRPGEIQIWKRDSLNSVGHTFWRPQFAPKAFSQEEFNDKLLGAVRYTSTADVEAGLLLSGGLDSSIIAALMNKIGKNRLSTYTCSYAKHVTEEVAHLSQSNFNQATNAAIDENYFANIIVKKERTNHHVFEAPDHLGLKEYISMIDMLGEPLASTDSIGHFLLARAMQGKTKLVLSGTGSDEVLGGYEHLYFKGANPDLQSLDDPLKMLELFSNFDDRSIKPSDYISKQLFDPSYINNIAIDAISHMDTSKYANEALNQLALFELSIDLPGWELDQADRLYMGHSIELRPAFVENDFVDYALSIASVDKRDKQPLKDASRGLVPDEIIDRPKYPSLGTPSSMYSQEWFQHGLHELRENPLHVFDADAVRALIDSQQVKNFDILYRLVYLQMWDMYTL